MQHTIETHSDYHSLHTAWWSTWGQETRRWAWYELGAFMCDIDTGVKYGPKQRIDCFGDGISVDLEGPR